VLARFPALEKHIKLDQKARFLSSALFFAASERPVSAIFNFA
jgi:hypothetical protein